MIPENVGKEERGRKLGSRSGGGRGGCVLRKEKWLIAVFCGFVRLAPGIQQFSVVLCALCG
jgi:hypothetical protein